MSTTIASATATCTIPEGTPTPQDVAVAIHDFIVNHEDVDLPIELEDYDSDEFVHELVPYLSVESSYPFTRLTISYDTEDDRAYSSDVFDFLVDHFKTLQTSEVMEVRWNVYDSREGSSSGTNYYRKDGKTIDVIADSAALNAIAELLSGEEWDSETMSKVAEIVRGTGREIKDVEE